MTVPERIATLAVRIDAALPQTQCTRCGFPDCRAYAEAVATGDADIDRCPPGGADGVRRLSALTGRPVKPLDPAHGAESPRTLAVVDEAWCIGCTLCIQACPVDCIVGAPKRMHTVLDALCTGCELCVPACPVDCIALIDAMDGRTGWDAWSATQAGEARARHAFRRARLHREAIENDLRLAARAAARQVDLPDPVRPAGPAGDRRNTAVDAEAHAGPAVGAVDRRGAAAGPVDRKRATVEAALARARARRAAG